MELLYKIRETKIKEKLGWLYIKENYTIKTNVQKYYIIRVIKFLEGVANENCVPVRAV